MGQVHGHASCIALGRHTRASAFLRAYTALPFFLARARVDLFLLRGEDLSQLSRAPRHNTTDLTHQKCAPYLPSSLSLSRSFSFKSPPPPLPRVIHDPAGKLSSYGRPDARTLGFRSTAKIQSNLLPNSPSLAELDFQGITGGIVVRFFLFIRQVEFKRFLFRASEF